MEQPNLTVEKLNKRYPILDSYRGFVVLNMIAFHFLYDWNMIFDADLGWYFNGGVRIWQQYICWSFIILSGFVWQYGKKKAWRRGLLLNVLGLVITLVTYIFIPSEAILFGILNFIGCATWLMIPLEKILKKVPNLIGMAFSMIVYLLLYNIDCGIIGIGSKVFLKLPDAWYHYKVLIPLGLPTPDFSSSDYFPILPWFMLYVFGFFFGRWFSNTRLFSKIQNIKFSILDMVGRHSVWFYMVHQPICYGICFVINSFL